MLKIKKNNLNTDTRFNLVLIFFIILSVFSIKNSSLDTKPLSNQVKYKNQTVLFENNKKILELENNSISPVLWQDILFYEQLEENNTSHLMSFDFKSKTISPIYQNQVGKKIGDFKIIDDILYLSVYKDNSEESMYSLNLFSSNLEPQKINQAFDQKIIKNEEKYFLVENFSNSPSFTQKCFLLDTKNRNLSVNIDCKNIVLNADFNPSIFDEKLPKNFNLQKFD